MHTIRIGGREVGGDSPCFIIAEAGVNHNGDLALAEGLVEAAAGAGADAIKFQSFTAERLASSTAFTAAYQRRVTGSSTQIEMLRALELDAAAHARLREACRRHGILFLSSPFDEESIDLLVKLGVPAIKLGSGEITNWPLLEHVAGHGLPVILSTGMASLAEVDEAVRVLRDRGDPPLALLHCVSAYPTPPEEANLRAIRTLSRAFDVPVGFSDHTLGTDVALAAVALGAKVIEKHFTLDRSLPGPDHAMSLTADALAGLVASVRRVESAFGTGRKEPSPAESENAVAARKSIVLAADIPRGCVISREHLVMKRPGDGLEARHLPLVVGRRAARDLDRDHQLTWEDLA